MLYIAFTGGYLIKDRGHQRFPEGNWDVISIPKEAPYACSHYPLPFPHTFLSTVSNAFLVYRHINCIIKLNSAFLLIF